MSEPKHTPIATPRPWRITVGGGTIIGPDIAEGVYPQIVCGGADRGDQELIVRAVNAHEHLVGALESVAQAFAVEHIAEVIPPSVAAKVKAALRAARGES